jgi:hypothetical protein
MGVEVLAEGPPTPEELAEGYIWPPSLACGFSVPLRSWV